MESKTYTYNYEYDGFHDRMFEYFEQTGLFDDGETPLRTSIINHALSEFYYMISHKIEKGEYDKYLTKEQKAKLGGSNAIFRIAAERKDAENVAKLELEANRRS